jgi:hypothetical protein
LSDVDVDRVTCTGPWARSRASRCLALGRPTNVVSPRKTPDCSRVRALALVRQIRIARSTPEETKCRPSNPGWTYAKLRRSRPFATLLTVLSRRTKLGLSRGDEPFATRGLGASGGLDLRFGSSVECQFHLFEDPARCGLSPCLPPRVADGHLRHTAANVGPTMGWGACCGSTRRCRGMRKAQKPDQPIRHWRGSARGSNVGRRKPTHRRGGSYWLCWIVGVCVVLRLGGGGRGFLTNQLLCP